MSEPFDWKNGIVAIIGHRPDMDRLGPIGAGFVVTTDGLIVTCHHVVEQSGWPFEKWDIPIQVRFQANGLYADALILQEYLRRDLDLAVLRLEAELLEKIEPLPLFDAADAAGHTTRMWGYPADFPKGLLGRGEVLGIEGRGQLQLTSTQTTHGYSGGPVWDERWQRVIGMITTGAKEDKAGKLKYENFAIPVETLRRACSQLPLSPPDEAQEVAGKRKPMQRPPSAEHFTDREADLEWLLDALQPGRAVTVWASGGMGKTALTWRALRQLAPDKRPPERFPDGVVFYSFYGRPETALALEHVVRSFDEGAEDVSEDAVRRALAGKQALLVLDGAEEAADLGAVLRLSDSNGVLITSRKRGDAPDASWRRELKPLPQTRAVDLLNAWQEADVSGPVGQAIVERVGRLPLALRLAGRYLDETGESPEKYLAWLEDSPIGTLSPGEHREDSVELLLEKSMGQVGHMARRALSVSGQLAFSDFGWEPVAAALDERERPVRQALSVLYSYGLINRDGPDRYALSHALVHTYARRQLVAGAAVIERLAGYYAGLAEEESEKGLAGYRRLDSDRLHFIPVLRSCLAVDANEAAVTLVWAIDDYMDYQGHGLDRVQVLEMGLTAAVKLGERYDEMVFTSYLAAAYHVVGRVEKAIDYHERALAMSQETGDRFGEGTCLGNLGLAYRDLGQVEKAIDYHEQALAINRETGDRGSEGNQLGNLGAAYYLLGQVEKASEYYRQALAISREIGDRRSEGTWLGNLGSAYSDLGQVDTAIKCYQQGLAISQEIGDRRGEGIDLGNLGTAYLVLEQVEKAIDYYQQTLAISREVGDRRNEGVWLGNLGLAYDDLGQVGTAIDYYRQALAISQEIGDRNSEGIWLGSLGNAYRDLGQVEKASDYTRQALAILEEIRAPDAEQARSLLAELEAGD